MMQIASMLPVNKKDDAAFLQFLEFLMMQIGAIQPGGVMIAPAGWSTGSGGHVMLLVLTRSLKELDKYSFAIVNTGEGLEYHAAHADPLTAEIKRNLAFVLHDVPAIRVTDTCFWFMVRFRASFLSFPLLCSLLSLIFARCLLIISLVFGSLSAHSWRRSTA